LENLKEAFARGAQMNRRYLHFARKADIEGHVEIGGMFRDVAEAETAHAFGHLDFLGGIGDPATGEPMGETTLNLRSAIGSETHDCAEVYPGYAQVARDEGFDELPECLEVLAPAEGSHEMATERATTYDPKATFEVTVEDVEYLTLGDGSYLARIYQPVGPGPFPTLVDIHGGAWSGSDRLTNAVTAQPLAESGLVVMSIDFRIAPEHPYPAQVQDANYAIRWLKANAGRFNGDVSQMGVLGRSSGGHTALLLAMRPLDERYAALDGLS